MSIEVVVGVTAGFAKGVAVAHGAIITAPAAGHTRTGVILAPKRIGTAAHAHGVGSHTLRKRAEHINGAHEQIVSSHGLDGHINAQIPGTFEHATGLMKSDAALIPQRIHEITQLVQAVGLKKFALWVFGAGPLGSLYVICC